MDTDNVESYKIYRLTHEIFFNTIWNDSRKCHRLAKWVGITQVAILTLVLVVGLSPILLGVAAKVFLAVVYILSAVLFTVAVNRRDHLYEVDIEDARRELKRTFTKLAIEHMKDETS